MPSCQRRSMAKLMAPPELHKNGLVFCRLKSVGPWAVRTAILMIVWLDGTAVPFAIIVPFTTIGAAVVNWPMVMPTWAYIKWYESLVSQKRATKLSLLLFLCKQSQKIIIVKMPKTFSIFTVHFLSVCPWKLKRNGLNL
jgi:hypothetical protein